MELGPCRVCGCPALARCSRCQEAAYCGPECQRADWQIHKQSCDRSREAPAERLQVPAVPAGPAGPAGQAAAVAPKQKEIEWDAVRAMLGQAPARPSDDRADEAAGPAEPRVRWQSSPTQPTTPAPFDVHLVGKNNVEVAQAVVAKLKERGVCVIKAGAERAFHKAVHMEAKQLWDGGAYTSASKGSPSSPGSHEITFNARDDKVICLSSSVLDALGKKVQALKKVDEQLANFGWGIKQILEDQLGLSLTKRTPGMLSCYDGQKVPDAQYGFHVDNPYMTNMAVPDDGRRLTLIFYISDGQHWDVQKDGGALQVCMSDPRRAPSSTAEALTHPLFTVAPDCDTLVAFWSHTMFHAVLPVTGTKPRFALSTWFMGS